MTTESQPPHPPMPDECSPRHVSPLSYVLSSPREAHSVEALILEGEAVPRHRGTEQRPGSRPPNAGRACHGLKPRSKPQGKERLRCDAAFQEQQPPLEHSGHEGDF